MTADEAVPRCKLEGWIKRRIAPLGIREWQLERLRQTVGYAKANSRYYARSLRDIEPERDIRSLEDVRRLPFVTPEELMQNGKQMLCVWQKDISRIVTLRSSGTTGAAKRVWFTAGDQELTVDFFANGMQEFTRPGDTVMILLPGQTEGTVGDLLAAGLRRMGQRPVLYGVIEDFEDALRRLAEERANVLVGIPQQVLKLARLYRGRHPGLDLRALHSVLLATDYVPDAAAAAVERAFSCRVYENYGMTEMGLGGGVSCRSRQGYHMREADLLTEIIDPATGRPVPAGTYGEVVFTTLTRRAMPLIRYRTGDTARYLPEPCRCGSSLPLLEKIQCRNAARAALANGETLSMPELDEALFALDEVLDFRAELAEDGLRLAVEALVPADRIAARLHAALEQCGIGARLRRNGLTVTVLPLSVAQPDRKAVVKRKITGGKASCR